MTVLESQRVRGPALVLGAPVGTDGPTSLWQAVAAACQAHGQRTALIGPGGQRMSYSELLEATAAAAGGFDGLTAPASRRLRLGLHCRNRISAIVLYYAALRAGCVPFLVDQGYDGSALAKIISSCQMDAIARVPEADVADVGSAGSAEWSALVEAVQPAAGPPHRELLSSTALCRFTTGSTGEPQALEFEARAVVAAGEAWMQGSGLRARDRVLCMAGLANGLAFNTSVLPAVLAGASVMFVDSILSSNSLCRTLNELQATRLVAFPRVYERLADSQLADSAAEALQSLDVAVSAGAPLSMAVKEKLAERWGLYISDYYGLAECGPCTFEVGSPASAGGLGRCLPGVELLAEPAGDGGRELLVKTESMAACYLNRPGVLEERMSSGYYRSGDAAELRDGRLFLAARSRRFVNQAGRKLDPAEVESCVLLLPGVAEAALVEVEHNGASLGALAVVAPGGKIGRADVVNWLVGSLGLAKLPARIVFVDRLERSSIGKVMTVKMQEVVSSALSSERDGQ